MREYEFFMMGVLGLKLVRLRHGSIAFAKRVSDWLLCTRLTPIFQGIYQFLSLRHAPADDWLKVVGLNNKLRRN
jgi:hypothetical protein